MKCKTTIRYVFYMTLITTFMSFSTSCNNNMITATFGGFIPASSDSKEKEQTDSKEQEKEKQKEQEKEKLVEKAFTKGDNAYKKKDYKKAISHFNTVIPLDPTNVEAYKLRGYSKVETNDDAGAVDDFTEAIKLYRKMENREAKFAELDLLEERAFSYEALGRTAEAAVDRTRIAQLNAELRP